MLIGFMRKMALRDVKVQKLANAYERKHGRLDSGFTGELAEFSAANPVFSDADLAAAQGAIEATPLAGPTITMPEGTPGAAAIGGQEEFDALPSGAVFTGPDGKMRRKQ